VGFWDKLSGTLESWFGLGSDTEIAVGMDGSGNLRFKDKNVVGEPSLSDLVAGGSGGITAEQHKVLRQLIHFIDDGPAEGFLSGAYREITGPLVFPTGVTWYESSDKLKKIVERTITWTGPFITVDVWKVYNTDGSTVIATVTDSISYIGAFEDERTRTIA